MKKTLLYLILAVSLATIQSILIAKFGILALTIPIFIAFLSTLLFNRVTALFVAIFSILFGQIVRIYLPSGGGIILSDLVAPAFILSWLAYKLIKDPKFKSVPSGKILAAVIITFLLTFIINWPVYSDKNAFLYLFRLLSYLLLFWPFYDLLIDKIVFKVSLKFVTLLFYLLIFLGFAQMIFFPYLIFLTQYGWDPHKNRLVSTFLDPNFFGGFLSIGFAFFVAQYYSLRQKKWSSLVPIFLTVIAIVLTFSRSGYLMFFTVLLIFGIFKDRRILAIGLISFSVLYFTVPKFQDRLVGGFNIDATAQMRLDSWNQGYKLISDHFVFGVGYNNLIQAKINEGILTDKEVSSHGDAGIDSSILAIWSTTGIVGLLIFILWYFWNCFSGFKAYFRAKEDKTRNFGLAIGAIFLGLFAHSFFVNSLLYPHIIIIVMIMLAIFYNLYEQKD